MWNSLVRYCNKKKKQEKKHERFFFCSQCNKIIAYIFFSCLFTIIIRECILISCYYCLHTITTAQSKGIEYQQQQSTFITFFCCCFFLFDWTMYLNVKIFYITFLITFSVMKTKCKPIRHCWYVWKNKDDTYKHSHTHTNDNKQAKQTNKRKIVNDCVPKMRFYCSSIIVCNSIC